MRSIHCWVAFSFLALCACPKDQGGEHAAVADAAAAAAPDLIQNEDERIKYVETNVEVSGFDISADTKPGDDGGVVSIGGLYKVAGLIKNKGDKAIKTARMTVSIMDESGKVIGTYFNDIAGNKRLAPGEERPFKFTIPEKKEYAGKFTFSVR